MTPSAIGVDVEKQTESISLKYLLKQVYAAHVSKVRDLESEVRNLTLQLENARRQAQEASKAECEKCKEMQSAFSACKEYKNALLEQSKRLKELESKFSTLVAPRSEPNVPKKDVASPPKITTTEPTLVDSLSDVLKFSEWDETLTEVDRLNSVVTEMLPFEDKVLETADQNETVMPPPPVSSKTLLHRRKIFSDEKSENHGSLSEGYTTSSDSNIDDDVVLVPDTLEISRLKNSPVTTLSFIKRLKKSKPVDFPSPDNKENSSSSDSSIKIEKNSQSKKRALSDLSVGETQNKRFSPEHGKDTMLKKKDDEVVIAKIVSTCKESSQNQVISRKKPEIVSGDNFVKDEVPKKNPSSETSKKVIPMKSVSELLKEAEGWASNFEDFDINDTQVPQSVPVISKHKNLKSDLQMIDDDFQPMSSILKDEELGSWKTSSKRSSLKKSISLKHIKSSSRFKLTLEAPSANWKKPNYKQTKLSKNLFVNKNLSSQGSNPNSKTAECTDLPRRFDSDEKLEGTTLCGVSELASLASINSTHAPGDHQHTEASTLEPSTGMLASSSSNIGEAVCVIERVSLNNEHTETRNSSKDRQECIETVAPLEETFAGDVEAYVDGTDADGKSNDHDNSFDKLPVPHEPNYKYKEDCVRGKVKRKQLLGFECKECEKYYTELGLNEDEKRERMQHCSRHRAKYVPPQTPEHFWELDFPNTEECKARGYVAETQKVKLKSRRRRPLANDNSES